MKSIITCTLMAALLAAAAIQPAAAAADPARVLIIPFDINAQQPLGYLREGIYDMLSTRMAIEGKTVLVDRKQVEQQMAAVATSLDEEQAVRMAGELGANYVLFGSLTLFGQTVSTDARFFDVKQNKAVVVFNQTGDEHGDIIAHVDQLSDEIKATVFGLKTQTAAAPPPVPAQPAPPATTQKPSAAPLAGAAAVGGGLIEMEEERPPLPTGRSRRFKERIDGIAAADIDGDTSIDIVFISRHTAFAYRIVESTYLKIGEFDAPSGTEFIGVDAADINQNGPAEIFITAINKSQRLNSQIIEWTSSGFKTITEHPNWYYRVIETADRGAVLLGQQRGTSQLFVPGVHELEWSAGAYQPIRILPLPKKLTVFGFSTGDVFNDGRRMVAAYDGKNRIAVFDDIGKQVWKSADKFGGNPLYMNYISGVKAGGNPNQNPGVKNRRYLPQRLFVTDLNGDGRNEVITAANKALAGGALQKMKTYSNGRIQIFSSQESRLYPHLKTAQLEGYISDVALLDADNDGRKEIVFAVVLKTGSLIGTTPKSVIYTLNLYSGQGG